MGRYAAKTSVSVARSRVEIEQMLERYGATSFASGWDVRRAQECVAFEFNGVQIRVSIDKPTVDADPRGQLHRQRWRALGLVIKAKLEAVESDISTFEEEFLAWIVTPGGLTLGERIVPQIKQIASNGRVPSLLPGPEECRREKG